jgi:signal transduction histidine kinase/predicted RNA-binding protein with RPS1 domain/DNA-binding NarL/FixJ family response regulator
VTHSVQVEVLEIQPAGILVKILDDQRQGFIRRRELSWDRRVSVRPRMPEVGERLEAKPIRTPQGSPYVYLSPRRLVDPWRDADQRYHLDQIVRGEVVNLRHFGVFVQLEPGLDAVVWSQDIPLRRGQRPADVLAVGDQIQGVITHFEPARKKLELSLTARLQMLSVASSDSRKSIQLELFKASLGPDSAQTSAAHKLFPQAESQMPPQRYHPPLPTPKKALIIAGDDPQLVEIRRYLETEFEIQVEAVRSKAEGLEKVRQRASYDLVLIELMPVQDSGLKTAQELLSLQPEMSILFISHDPQAEKQLMSNGEQRFPFALKEPEEIGEWLDKLGSGYWELSQESSVPPRDDDSFIQQLEMTAFARHALPDTLQQMLAELRRETDISSGLVLEVDLKSKAAVIIAADPPLRPEIHEQTLDALFYSPVRNVVEDQTQFYAAEIDQDRDPRFKNLLPLLAYQSCLGLPLTVPGLVTRHALFLFDEHRPALEPEVIDQAQLSARFMQVALERGLLLDYMRRYEQRYTLGQLLSSLVHELSNKLDGLEGHLASLPLILQRIETAPETERPHWLAEANAVGEDLTQTKAELAELVEAYVRLVSGEPAAVDVAALTRKVKRQMEARARGASLTLYLDVEPNLPPARAVQARLEQVLTNLLLNAIQQIEGQAHHLAQVARESGQNVALMQEGLIILKIYYDETEPAYPIQITVIDTGPGIHYHRQEEIFLMDTSIRRKGHGLGLYISRNLMEIMGGRLRLVDSLMFIGSVFVVELPAFVASGDAA